MERDLGRGKLGHLAGVQGPGFRGCTAYFINNSKTCIASSQRELIRTITATSLGAKRLHRLPLIITLKPAGFT